MDLYRYSPAFPEFAFPILQKCRKFHKLCFSSANNPVLYKTYVKACIDMAEKYSEYAAIQRGQIGCAPKDITTLEMLKPADVPNMKSRLDSWVEKEHKERDMVPVASGKKKEEDREHPKKKKKQKVDKPLDKEDDVLEVDDEVEQGVDWSSDEDMEEED